MGVHQNPETGASHLSTAIAGLIHLKVSVEMNARHDSVHMQVCTWGPRSAVDQPTTGRTAGIRYVTEWMAVKARGLNKTWVAENGFGNMAHGLGSPRCERPQLTNQTLPWWMTGPPLYAHKAACVEGSQRSHEEGLLVHINSLFRGWQ